MYGHTTGSSADFTSKKRPLLIAGQLVGPFTTGWGVARPAIPIGSRIATEGSVKRTVVAGRGNPGERQRAAGWASLDSPSLMASASNKSFKPLRTLILTANRPPLQLPTTTCV